MHATVNQERRIGSSLGAMSGRVAVSIMASRFGHTVGCRNRNTLQCIDRLTGGFGGGGGGGWDYGGGGGGYSGGNAPDGATIGGSSYLNPFSFTNGIGEAGVRAGNGLLTINFIGVPEPATWAMMIMGFGGVGAMIRRRRTALVSA
ncbi:PEPxxWA-CTERM sorting domain-containing protein [uncultured Phenylobacterium sp.]|uniref:PEPxxWA-CTERM sorting domain-containing protein n=1 Tax=uncultured Phenylobacterium sp. TaxID=349273 RepID=UPI0025FC2A62|nr:PEPxxWA-CTERM sorting domain-containing protein [uncultured Phenylobacterium sp.]